MRANLATDATRSVYSSDSGITRPTGTSQKNKYSRNAPIRAGHDHDNKSGGSVFPGFDKDVIRDALTDRAEDLFRDTWGEPAKAGAAQWRAKASSARSMWMRGAKRGQWHDFKSQDGGDVLDFFAAEFCGLARAVDDFPRVLAEAAGWAGIAPDAPAPDPAHTLTKRRARENQAEAEAEQKAAQDAALIATLATTAQAVEGTPAAAYLAGRGISATPPGTMAYLPPLQGQPGLLHPHRAALVVWGRDDAGQVMGGQRVLIMPDGSKAPEDARKPSFASIAGHPARFTAQPGKETGPLCVAEGPESALAVWQATGFEVWAVFGVSGFATAPLPMGRRVILCPDQDPAIGTYPAGSQDAQDKETAARTFAAAVAHHTGRGADIRVAYAPEPAGSKRDLNDTLQRAGADAVAQAIAGAVRRGSDGRFTGAGLVPFTGDTAETLDALPIREAMGQVDKQVKAALDVFRAWDGDGDAPVHVIKAAPGTGKSTLTRRQLAEGMAGGTIAEDVHFYAPTLGLADDAAAHTETLDAPCAVTRGRLARNPATGKTMCDRPDDVERAGKLGAPISLTMCKAKDDKGQERLCPFYETCAYNRQFADLPAGGTIRFEAHNYLTIPDPAKDRATAFRVIDETFFRGLSRAATVTIDDICTPPPMGKCKTSQEKDARAGAIADMIAAAHHIAQTMRAGGQIEDAIGKYFVEDLQEFAKTAGKHDNLLPIFPDTAPDKVEKALKAGEIVGPKSGAVAAFWRILSEVKGITNPQNVVFVAGYKPLKSSDPRDVFRIFWKADAPRDVPVLILDADADPVILEQFYPGAVFHETHASINASVTYITDRTFSNTTLSRKSVRDELRGVIAVERFNDAGGGVLVAATRKIVQQFFTDAGHDFTGQDPKDVSRLMLETPLHGVNWAWFGAATLGSNRWQDCTTALILGREEWPVDGLQDAARSLWHHDLELLDTDAQGRCFMPQVEMPFPMADGTTRAVIARAHPDPRVRAIQNQARECATRQTVERLRLARAPIAKRVVIACGVPVPGLPADHALTWDEYKPTRFDVALAEANGALRISPKGLAADAPGQFSTANAAGKYLFREKPVDGPFDPHTTNKSTISGMGVKSRVLVSFKITGVKGRMPTRAVLLCAPDEAENIARDKWGDLTGFEVLEVELCEDDKPAVRADCASVPPPPVTSPPLHRATPAPPAPMRQAEPARQPPARGAIIERAWA